MSVNRPKAGVSQYDKQAGHEFGMGHRHLRPRCRTRSARAQGGTSKGRDVSSEGDDSARHVSQRHLVLPRHVAVSLRSRPRVANALRCRYDTWP